MTKWYKIARYRDTIEAVDVVKETTQTLTILCPSFMDPAKQVEIQYRKHSKWEHFYPTLDEALNALRHRHQNAIEQAQAVIAQATTKLEELKTMKEPT